MEEFTNAQKRDTQMLPNDSIAQYETHPGKRAPKKKKKKRRKHRL